MEEFMDSQKNILGIADFLKSASQYTQENFPDWDMDKLFESAIHGNMNTNFWTNNLLNFARTRS